MKLREILASRIRALVPEIDPADREAVRETRPFYVIVEVVLAALYGSAIVTVSELRTPFTLTVFTGVMAVHGTLHWISPRLMQTRSRLLPYFAIQGVLAFAIVLVTNGFVVSMSFGLFAPLIGEAIGMLRGDRKSTLIVTFALVLLAAGSWFASSRSSFHPIGLLAFIPITFFVVTYTVLYSKQIEARERAQRMLDELEEANRRLAAYSERIEELTVTNERQRMARELHDTLTQDLSGLVLQLEAVESFMESGKTERAAEVVRRAMESARRALAESRNVIRDLRRRMPAESDILEKDFAEAVRTEAERFEEATGITCLLTLREPVLVPSEIREHAYRAITEGLANAARHANASAVKIGISDEGGRLEIEIADDGIGFDPDTIRNARNESEGHYGLLGLRERARLAGGTFDVDSSPGRGTKLLIRFPANTSASEGKA